MSGEPGRHGRRGPTGPSGRGIKGMKGEAGVPGASLKGEPGPPGPPGRSTHSRITSTGSTMTSRTMCCHQEKVAFMAGLSRNFQGRNSGICFDHVITNHGGAYRSSSGCFVVPAAGCYVFHVHILRCRSSGPLYVHLMRNADIISSATNQDSRFETTSSTAVLQLRRGDVVWVRLRQGVAYGHSPSHYSTFSGYSVQLDEAVDVDAAFAQQRYKTGISYSLYKGATSNVLTEEAAARARSMSNSMSMPGND